MVFDNWLGAYTQILTEGKDQNWQHFSRPAGQSQLLSKAAILDTSTFISRRETTLMEQWPSNGSRVTSNNWPSTSRIQTSPPQAVSVTRPELPSKLPDGRHWNREVTATNPRRFTSAWPQNLTRNWRRMKVAHVVTFHCQTMKLSTRSQFCQSAKPRKKSIAMKGKFLRRPCILRHNGHS